MWEARVTLAVFLVVILYAMFGGLGMQCQQAAPECPVVDESVRHVRILEDISQGIRIEADIASGLIIKEKPCYEGDPGNRCLWVSCPAPVEDVDADGMASPEEEPE